MECGCHGYFSQDQIDFPEEHRLREKPVAVAECCQEIPCNPCVDACPVGAIAIENNINFIPRVDFSRCTGCGLCLGVCPGLSIFLVHLDGEVAHVTLPYELFPPEKDEKVELLDRAGKMVGTGQVERIRGLKQHDRTILITIRMDGHLVQRVRGFRRLT